MALTIWCNAKLPDGARRALEAGTRAHRLVVPEQGLVAASGEGVPDEGLATADVAFGQPEPTQLISSRARWVQLSSAGYNPYDRDDLRTAFVTRGAMLTKSSLVYDAPCAEHALAFMLAHERRLPDAMENQRAPRAWPQHALRASARRMGALTIALVGYGSIGRRLTAMLAPMGANVVGIRRRAGGDDPVPTFVWGTPAAAKALATADHVVDLLPGGPGTRHAFDAAVFASLKPGAIFVNIGRGSTVDQTALVAALASGQLAAAYLDVTDPEPLPPDHALWTTPNCFVSPHVAGGHADESERLVCHFLDNLSYFERGLPLLDRVY
ncbi:MAG TPA: D-2-hydroxyacid dehydrogenase [Polyangia bacterium]|nr:D-2-hydroxyacid dehydrogenase [Polyangia bacterium]